MFSREGNSMWICIRGILFIAAILLFPAQLMAETLLFRGNLEVVTGSGKLCEKVMGRHDISLVLEQDSGKPELRGFFEGKELTIGKFSGTDLTRMTVIYPYYDEERATGHLISLSRSNSLLVGELHDKHADEALEECSFDLATLNLQLAAVGEPAEIQLQQAAKLFDAELANSRALAFIKKGDYEKALPLFKNAIDLSDAARNHDLFPLDSSIVGLASSYFWLGRFKEFNQVYDSRFATVTDEQGKAILNGQRFTAQFHLGNEAVKRGEHDEALKILLPAYTLNMQNMEIVGSIITSYLQSERFSDAISFLEQAVPKLGREADRTVVVGTIAMISFFKAKKDEKDGREIEAEAGLRKAVSLNPAHAPFLVALARQRHKAGNFEEASKLLQDGLNRIQDDPSRKEIVAALEKLQKIETILKSVR